MNCVEKIVKGMLKVQVDKYITENKPIPGGMHGTRKYHNITTAKLQINKEVNKHRDNRRKENLFSQKPVQVLYTPLGNPISVQPAQKSATTRSFREDSCCIREEIQKALQ